MKLPIIYAAVFVVLTWAFVVDQSARTAYVPLKEGLLYSVSVGSHTTLNDEVTEKILFKRTAEDEYPTIEAATTESLPGKFLVRVIGPQEAKYRLVTASSLVGKGEVAGKAPTPLKTATGGPKKGQERPADQAKAAIAAVTVQKEVPQEILNVNKVRDIVNNSDKTYFFSGAERTLNDVTLKVKSITPWQNRSILTLELSNDQAKYFFISNIAVVSAGLPLQADLFNDPFLPGNKAAALYIWTARPLKSEAVAVKLSESAGSGRSFDLSVGIP